MSEGCKLDERLTPEQHLANDLELRYWDKRESFWQRMFLGCCGFVTVVTPLALMDQVPDKARHCLFGAVVMAAVCAALLIFQLRRSARCMWELVEQAKAIARCQSRCSEFTPQDMTRLERISAWGAAISFIVALVSMVGVFIFSW